MKLFRKLFAALRKQKLDTEMAEEMRAHLDMQTAENERRGMRIDEAHYAAHRSFGGVDQIKEQVREQRRFMWIEHLLQDLRYAVRTARKTPGFTATTILTLALGIGANTAVFTAMTALVWNTLPVRAPDELVILSRKGTAAGVAAVSNRFFSFPLYERLRTDAPSLSSVAALSYSTRTLLAGPLSSAEPDVVNTSEVTGNFFSTVGVSMTLGRALSPSDDRVEDPQAVVVISHGYWERRFASDPAIVGKSVTIDNVPFTIVGVAASGFTGVETFAACDGWLPLHMRGRFDATAGAELFREDDTQWLSLLGRLPADNAVVKAATEADHIYQRYVAEIASLAGSNWANSPQRRIVEGRLTLLPGQGGYNESIAILRPLLTSVSVIVVLVLFIACANVASLTLARAEARRREFAVRLALGGGRTRLILQVLTETLLFALMGGACGLLLARWGLDVLVSNFFPPERIAAAGFNLSPDRRILAFTTAVAVATGVLVGLLPALRFSRPDLVTALKSQGSGSSGPARQRLNRSLIVAQLAVSVCLLAGAGLFIRTVQNIRDTNLGFNRTNTLRIQVQTEKNTDLTHRAAMVDAMIAGLRTLPGVQSTTVAEGAVIAGAGDRVKIDIDGYVPGERENMSVPGVKIGPGFFENMGIPLLQGRAPNERETLGTDDVAPGVVVISESAAKRYFGAGNPLGHRIRIAGQRAPLEVIGVVRDVKFSGPRQETPIVVYLPFGRIPSRAPRMTFYVRTTGDPLRIAPDVSALARRVVPGVPQRGPLMTVENLVDLQMFQEQAIAQVASFFSGFSLLLACVGLYGVMAYNVAQRTREIGVRMALGADRGDVLGLVLKQGLQLAALGCVLGLAVAVGLVTLASRLLYGVKATDPSTLLATTGALLGVAMLASWLPARRATKIDPIVALRCE